MCKCAFIFKLAKKIDSNLWRDVSAAMNDSNIGGSQFLEAMIEKKTFSAAFGSDQEKRVLRR